MDDGLGAIARIMCRERESRGRGAWTVGRVWQAGRQRERTATADACERRESGSEVTADGRPDKRGMIGREADEDTYDFWMHVGGVQEDVERRGYGC